MKSSKKTEVKNTASVKPASAKTSEVKAETKPVAKATASKTAAAKKTAAPKSDAAKPATAKKTAAAKPAAKKTAANAAAKTSAKTSAKRTKTSETKTAAKKTPKSKAVTIETICTKLEKKISKTKAAAIKDTIAVDIEVWGFEDGSNQKMYVELKDGKASVAPHSYDDKSFRVSLSFANAVAFVEGKITLAALLDSKDFYAEGKIVDAVKFASIF